MGKYNATVTPKEAARRLGMSRDMLYECLKQDKLPIQIGFAVKGNRNTNYAYKIYENKLEALERFWGLVD